MLVDPHWVMRSSLERSLMHAGASRVVAVESLTKALELVAQPFDLLITELSLGDGGGASLVRLARNVERPPAIVAMAARVRAGESMDVPEGVDTFVFKPFTSDQLMDAIRRAQSARLRRRGVAFEPKTGVRSRGAYRAAKDKMLFDMVENELRLNGGSIRATAMKLGVSRTTVRRLIERSAMSTASNVRRIDDAG